MNSVSAVNVLTGEELWSAEIYSISKNPFVEQDFKWVYISSIVKDENSLIVTNERGLRYRLNLKSHKVKKMK